MINLFKRKSEIEKFWEWFAKNKSVFENINNYNIDSKLDLLLENLSLIESGLAVEVSNEFNEIRELIISPEGDKEKFDIVLDIINKAPVIEGWLFTAFRHPIEGDFTLKYKELEFTPSKMFFLPFVEKDKLDLIIYVEKVKLYDYQTVAYYGLITMDNILGEYDCVMKVRNYDFVDLNKKTDKTNLKPLSELKLFVREFYSKMLN